MSRDSQNLLVRLRTAEPRRRIRGRNLTKADILVYRLDEQDLAVKDYSARPWIVRNTLGRWLVRREAAAYRRAAGLPGLPEFLGRLGSFALVTRWVDATPLAALPIDEVPRSTFDEVGRILDSLHEHGVALSDLHHRDVLLGPDGSVRLVDLAMAWVLGDRPGRLRRAVFERVRDQDRVALARMRARFGGGDVERAPDGVGRRAAAWHRRGRRLRRILALFRRSAR